MRIDKIVIKNFRSLQEVTMDNIGNLTVLIRKTAYQNKWTNNLGRVDKKKASHN